MKLNDYVVSFRFPCDDFFVFHETNVQAKNAKEAVMRLTRYIPNAEEVQAELGVVMLYGKPYTTIKSDLPRSEQMKIPKFELRKTK